MSIIADDRTSYPAPPSHWSQAHSRHHIQGTPSSSATTLDITDADRQALEDEERIERYGADDVHDPPPRPTKIPLSTSSTTETALAPTSAPAEKPKPGYLKWDGPDDPENPQNWPKSTKWKMTALAIITILNVTFASSAPSAAIPSIMTEFNVSAEVADLITSVFLLGYVFGPIFWGPGSELVGRRPIFIGAMTMYTIFILGQALAQNVETLLVTRFLSGFFAAAPLTNCGGLIADIWDPETRGTASSLFTASVFMGPVLGPIISGAIIHSGASWRWIFWVMMVLAGISNLAMMLRIRETYAPIILAKKAKRMRKADPKSTVQAEHENQDWSPKGLLNRTIYRPFKMLAVEPILLLVTVYLSIIYGVLYALFEALPIVFMEKYSFNVFQNGLIFVGVGIGTTLGALINWSVLRHYPRLIREWKGFPPPEQRLFGAMIGGPSMVIGCFWLGWSGNYASVPWIVPALSTIIIGMSIALVFTSFLSYLIDTYLMYSASALAANAMIRSLIAAAFPLFTVQMFTKLGVNWAGTLFGLISLVLAPSPFLFYKFGARIRGGSTFAPCIDLQIAKEMEERTEGA